MSEPLALPAVRKRCGILEAEAHVRIARNGNDMVAKYLTLALPGESLSALGIRGAHVARAVATEFPR